MGVGTIKLSTSGRSFRLFMPRGTIQELTDSEVVFVGEDSANPFVGNVDSIAQATERTTDSILESKRPTLESLGVNVPRRPRGSRTVKPAVADSVRRR